MTEPSAPQRSSRARLLIPLSLAMILSGAFVYLVIVAGKEEPEPEPVETAALATPDTVPGPGPERPFHQPGEKPRFEPAPKPNFGGEFPRWNISKYPKGWDPELAASIHAFFEAMEFDPRNPKAGLSKTREEFREFLESLGPEALPTLGAILNAEGDFVDRRFLLYAIGGLGPESEEATFILKDFLVNHHEDPKAYSEMTHTLDAMARLQNETSLDTITGLLGQPSFAPLRPKMIDALGTHPHIEDAIDEVIPYLHDDPKHQTRNKAAQFLGRAKHPDTLDEVYDAFSRERHWVVKQTLLGTVGKIGNPNSIPFLESQARNAPESAVRLSAGRAISRIGTPYAGQVLREIAQSEPDAKLKANFKTWASEVDG